MSTQPEPSTQEVLAGIVERCRDRGWPCRKHFRRRVDHGLGEWVNDRTHGQQFKARFLRTWSPTSADGIDGDIGHIDNVAPTRARSS